MSEDGENVSCLEVHLVFFYKAKQIKRAEPQVPLTPRWSCRPQSVWKRPEGICPQAVGKEVGIWGLWYLPPNGKNREKNGK